MELEKQVVSLELSRRLKELGVKQKSLFWWEYILDSWRLQVTYHTAFKGSGGVDGETELVDLGSDEAVSAFTAAEIGEMLPNEIDLPDDKPEYWGIDCALFIQDKDAVMYGKYGTEVVPDALSVDIKGNEADARAKMLIYLIENNLLPHD